MISWLLMRIGLFLSLIVASTALALSIIPNLERSDAVFTARVLSTTRVRVESNNGFKWELWKAEVLVQATLKQDTNLLKQTTVYFPQDHETVHDHYIMSCPARPRIATNTVYEFYCVRNDVGTNKHLLYVPQAGWAVQK